VIANGYGTIAKKVKLRITQFNNVDNLEVISKLPVLLLYQQIGKGTWSIDIQENGRILFEINQDPITRVKLKSWGLLTSLIFFRYFF